ncbi:MAG: hypothetical protein IMW89_16320 [Ktedonobacteraceae bacterium]|nr:hypothetical protein [Ktedonobacteraceae bacterium]
MAIDSNGGQVKPVWGPTYHASSTWHRPGQEWGTGFTLPRPGCWDLHVTRSGITWEGAVRGHVTGDVFLLIH